MAGAMTVQDLTFGYPTEPRPIITDLSFDVPTGQVIGVVGANGSGKSTLALIAAGCLQQQRGSVRVNGANSSRTRRAFVFQQYGTALFPWLTLWQNIVLPGRLGKDRNIERTTRYEDRARALLARLGADLPLDRYPGETSGGQRQLAHIVQALATDPDLLVLDEPFSALDIQFLARVLRLLQEECRRDGRVTILISHGIETIAALCDVVVALRGTPVVKVDVEILGSPHPYDVDADDKGFATPNSARYRRVLRLAVGGWCP